MILQTGKKKHFLVSQDSFTLIELILVVLIISVLVGISIPRFGKTFTEIELDAAANKVVSLIRYAQARSIVERETFRLNIDAAKGKFWVTRKEQDEFARIEGRFGRVFSIPGTISCIADSEKIDFSSDGSSQKADIILIGKTRIYKLSAGRAIGHVNVVRMQK